LLAREELERWAMSFLRKLLGLPFQADVRSIRRYEEVKHRVARDLVFYANAIVGDEDASAAERRKARQTSNRQSAADLELAARSLPWWYRRRLHWRGEKPVEASKSLIGLANAASRDDAEKHVADVKRWLRL
jgi:hypothetical protein